MSDNRTPNPPRKLPSVVSENQSRRGGGLLKVKNPCSPSQASPFIAAQGVPKSPVIDTKKCPPQASRVILDVESLENVMQAAMCRSCKEHVKIQFQSLGISSVPKMVCHGCGATKEGEKPQTSVSNEKKKCTRLTDAPVNAQLVLACMLAGDGGSEAQKLLGMLDLPRATSMEKSYFSRVEQSIAPVIIELAEEVMEVNLKEEVQASLDKMSQTSFIMIGSQLWNCRTTPTSYLIMQRFVEALTWDGKSGVSTH